ncbi:hypothetical protein [Mycolicibacterium grossiae]|uniref:hypothetical protein n=1 Tax=Mycolicibacterium grossiae TaxID=1552759 RepID=UPI000A41C69D|nr:hypothetical protein [Mycolicibacterium grossiae]QEM47176.1 hypothetical protein FZ046_22510 [Mycolicibacterium grossiae]
MSNWLNEAIRATSNDVGAAATSTSHRQQIIDLKAAYTKACDDVRGDISLSELGKQQLIARAWVNTKTEIARLQQADFDTLVTRYNKLERQVFGTAADSAGADAVSFRDAVDRASKLDNDEAAAKLLGTAELSGDTILAKAVVMRAWEARWNDVVDHYAVNHATVADTLAELVSLRNTLDSRVSKLGGALGANLPRPTELQNLSLAEVQSYADAEPSLSASHVLNNRFTNGITPTQERQAREQAIAEARNGR